MNSLTVNFPVAPPTVMPEPLQTIFFWITGIAALGLLLYSFYLARKDQSAVPVLLIIAAGAAIPLEPICGFLGHVVHPVGGSMRMFETVTRVIPWHMFFAYIAGFGVMYLVLYSAYRNKTLTRKFAWTTCATGVLLYIVVEIYPVSAGLWVYYDPQPLWLWQGMAPLTWSFMNTACEFMGATLILFMLPHLTGVKQLLIVPLAPMGALMGHMGSGWPMYSVINSSAASNNLLVQLSGVATLGCALFIMWICVTILCREETR